jgi:hypothetical protein
MALSPYDDVVLAAPVTIPHRSATRRRKYETA